MSGNSPDSALRVRLADAALHARVPSAPAWGDLPEYVREVWLGAVKAVVAEVVAYGDERAAEVLRDAADDWPGVRAAVTGTVHGWLRHRADELDRGRL